MLSVGPSSAKFTDVTFRCTDVTRGMRRPSCVAPPHMLTFLIRRLLHAVAIVACATIGSFVLLRIAPGDPLGASVEQRGLDEAARATLRARYGLDRPLSAQVASFAAATMRGDLGFSISEGRPAAAVLADALPATMALSAAALLLAVAIGIGTGTLQAWRPGDRMAAWLGTGLTLLYALPEIVVAVALLALLGLGLRLFPIGGMTDPLVDAMGGTFARLRDRAWHLALPALALALAWAAAIARQQRVAMRDVVEEDFVRTARAKGARPFAIWTQHAMRPSLPATVALIGTMLPVLVGGAVVVETLFSWPGMGALVVRGVGVRDYPLVAATVIVTSAAVAVGTLVADLLVLWLDPRLRHGAST
jgi:peptide/nickel transport system permease protein